MYLMSVSPTRKPRALNSAEQRGSRRGGSTESGTDLGKARPCRRAASRSAGRSWSRGRHTCPGSAQETEVGTHTGVRGLPG